MGAFMGLHLSQQIIWKNARRRREEEQNKEKEKNKTSIDDLIKAEHRRLESRRLEEERERKHREIVQQELKDARELATFSEENIKEIESTGFFTATKEYFKYVGDYAVREFGYFEDYIINIFSDKPIGTKEIESIVHAYLYLNYTENKKVISKNDFKKAIKIGGYQDISNKVISVHQFENTLSIYIEF